MHVAADNNDVLDLVDEQDQVIGTINQADAFGLIETKAGYIRGIGAFVQNDEGQLWIPARQDNKRIVPGGLDFSVAEHVQSGESYLHATLRGFKEELYLDLSEGDLEHVATIPPIPEVPYFFFGFFLHHANVVVEYNRADYKGARWLHPQEVLDLIDSGVRHKSGMKGIIERYLISS